MAGTVARILRPAENIGDHPVARGRIMFEWLAVKNLRITELELAPGERQKMQPKQCYISITSGTRLSEECV